MTAVDLLALVCAAGCGLVAGVFFSFSTAVMKALGNVPASCGMAVMQSINAVILNVAFLGVFLGTAAACAAVLVVCLLHPESPGMLLLIAACVLYLGGSLAVTVRCNVPRNNALARLNPAAPEAAVEWRDYLAKWTFWNHVRTVASFAASILFMLRAWLV